MSPISFIERLTLGSFKTKFAIVRHTLRLPTPISLKFAFLFKLCKHFDIYSVALFDSLLSATAIKPCNKLLLILKKGEFLSMFNKF